MIRYTPTGLFDAINEQLMLNGLRTYPVLNKGFRSTVKAYIDWCAERDVDPVQLMMARHGALKWKRRIGIKQLMQTSDKFLQRFRDWGSGIQQAETDQQALWGTAEADTGGLHLAEVLKRTWASDLEVCMAAPETAYSPTSRWCAACHLAVPCRRRHVRR